MISNHYAMTYGGHNNWLVLIAVSFAGACLRAWFVARHRRQEGDGLVTALPAIAGILTLAVVIYALVPSVEQAASAATPPAAVQTAQVQSIVEQRCVPCHSVAPTQPGFSAPPNGLVFQTLDQLGAHLPEVQQQLNMHTSFFCSNESFCTS